MAAKTTDPIDILLEMGIDLDNLSEEEDYLSALMEAANTLTIKDASDPRIAPLQQEILKLRKKRFSKARPEAKKTTIKPDAFFERKPDKVRQDVKTGVVDPSKLKFSSAEIAPKQKALPTSAITPYQAPEEEEGEKKKRAPRKSDPLKDILKGVNSIIEILKRQQKLSANQAEKDRKRAEKQKREGAENKLEDSGIKSFISGASKLIKPVKGFLDGLFDFIKNILIGTILIKIINWFSDPENQEKLEAIGDFFKNTWPVLLAAYLLFGNSFGRFAVKLIKVVGGFVIKLASKIIPALFGAAKRFGFGKSAALVGIGVGGAMLAGRLMDGGEDDKDLNQPDKKQKTPPPDKPADDKDTPTPAPAKMEGGGIVPGSGPNKDTVPAMLAPGEFVMSRGAVSKYGADTMASMNAAGGGTNLPKRMNGVTYAVGGGLMGDMSQYGYDPPKPSSSVEKPHTENKDLAKKSASESTGSGFFGGIKKMFGFGSDDKGPVNDKNKAREGADGEENQESGSTLSDIQQKALQVLAKYESGAAGYDAVNQIGTKGGRGVEGFSGDIKKMPQHEGRSLTDFTLGEIKALQYDDKTMTNSQWIKAGKLHAVGAYQFIGNTLPGVASRAGIPDTAKFTPAVQDLMALQLIKERGISPWVGPSDKATASERAIVEQARLEPIAYDNTSGKGAITAFGGGGGSYTPPGGGPGGASPSGTTMASLSNYKFGSGIAMLTGGKTASAGGSPSGTTFASLQGNRSVQSPPGPPPTSPPPTGGPGDSMSGGSQQGSTGNSAAKQTNNANNFPEIDANAMISMEKVKVLGLTLA